MSRPNAAAAPAPAIPAGDARRTIVLIIFLLSGATALAYQVVWVRMLTLVFGATVLSIGSVLASFMAGLALGSWYWSRGADRTTRPLRMYAFLELGIALSALLTPLLFSFVQLLYRELFVGGLSDFNALSVVRFLLCLPALLLPTFLMGGTLPVLARFYTKSLSHIGRGAGDLYAVNTLGAVVGTVLAGFFLIPALGVQATLVTAAAVNLMLAFTAWALSLRAEFIPPAEMAPPHRWLGVDLPIAVVLVGFGLSGFAAMIYEVAWSRALVQVFGNSTYAFTTMLAAFLIGLALGAEICGRVIDRSPRPFFVFAMLQLGIGLWAAVATPLIEWLPPVFLEAYERFGASFGALQTVQFFVCALLMLPVTLALGAVFPTVSRIYAARAGGAGTSVGIPYACNTLGTVFGALLAGFLFLPRLGVELSILIGVILNLTVWLAVLFSSRQLVLSPARLVALGLLALFVCARLGFARLDPQVMSAGVYMYPEYFLTLERSDISLRQAVQLQELLYHREGYSASVAVMRLRDGSLALQTNGKTDASTGDLSTQRALAHLPLLLQPHAREVLVVGLASGCTVGSALLYPVERVDCVEIEPAMLEAARFFDEWNHECLDDPRFRAILQDARNYVMMTDRRYDMITAEPTNPWIAGINSMFTVEYYRQCLRLLRPGGVMCQWLPAYNFTPEELRTALASFAEVFPEVTVWSFPNMRSDFFAIGSMESLELDPRTLAERLQGEVREDLLSTGADDLWTFGGALLLDNQAVRSFAAGAPLNTDERPRLEFSTPRHLYDPSLKFPTMQQAHAAGASSRLALRGEQARAALGQLAVKLNSIVEVTGASLVPHHPDPLREAGLARDVAELRLGVETPLGPGVLRAAPLPRLTWPASLAGDWPPTESRHVEEREGLLRAAWEVPGARGAVLWELRPREPHPADLLQQLQSWTWAPAMAVDLDELPQPAGSVSSR